MNKKDLLRETIQHIDIKKIDATEIVEAMKNMSFSARELANASVMFDEMQKDKDCVNILTIAGSTSAAGCMQIYVDMIENNMIDVVVATGATIVDMDFFEALGFKHYKGTQYIDDAKLHDLYIDRIYDTFIDEDDLQKCDYVITEIANNLEPRPYSSREFIYKMGEYLEKNSDKAVKKNSLVQTAYKKNVPIFCPAFSDSSAGFGLVLHQVQNPDNHITLDSVKDFYELTQIKIHAQSTGLLMIGGGVPKNFTQDIVVCAKLLGKEVPIHKYAIQITVADVRDGACSSSTLKEAHSWGKVDQTNEQMVFGEVTALLPLLASYAYHKKNWQERPEKQLTKIFN